MTNSSQKIKKKDKKRTNFYKELKKSLKEAIEIAKQMSQNKK